MADITGSLKLARLYFTSGSWRIIPSGSATVGYSASAGIVQETIVSMSANTNNIHTPTGETGSYYIISGSTLQVEQPAIVFVAADVDQKVRVLPYSSSVEGKFFTFTGSIQRNVGVKHAVIYTTYTYGPGTDSASSAVTGSSNSEFFTNEFEPNFGIEDTIQDLSEVRTRTPDFIYVSTLATNAVTSSYNKLTGSADLVMNVPVHVSASALQIAQETKRHIDFSSSYVTTTLSRSADFTSSFYGMLITNKAPGLFNKPTGSTSPPFTFEYVISGSITKIPDQLSVDGTQTSIIPVHVTNGETLKEMITSSILAINGFPQFGLSASFIPTSQSIFKVSNLSPGLVNAPTHTYARGIITSTLVSGSGTRGQVHVEGEPDKTKAVVRIEIDDVDNKSIMLSGSGAQKLYMSGSGEKIGFNTTNPEKELDFRADEMQFSKKSEQKGLRINKFGDLESYNFDAASSATGSEIIMSYQAGGISTLTNAKLATTLGAMGLAPSTEEEVDEQGGAVTVFAELREDVRHEALEVARKLGFFSQASVGDVIGALRWVVNSGSSDEDVDTRKAGEAATIKGIVTGVNDTDGGITSKLDFSIAKTTAAAPSKLFSIDPQVGIICSSSLVLRTGNNLHVGSAAVDGTDRIIDFRHGTAPFIMGVDDSRNVFAIHSANTFNSSGTNEFEMTSAGLASFKFSLGVGTVLSVGTNLTVGGYGRIDALRVGTTSTNPGDGNLYIEDDIVHVGQITASGDISSSGTITALSASVSKLTVTDTNIIGQRHILFNSGVYINDNPLLADNGYFGSSLANTPSNWNDPVPASFDSSAGTFEDVIDITEDEHGSKTFFAPFPVSRIEVLSSWRTAGTGANEKFWCGIWTGSAGVRLGVTSSAHNTVKNIGFVTGSIHEFYNGGDWNGHNNDIDFTFTTPLPPFTQIYYGIGSGEASSIGTKNIRGHITMMVYEA